MKKVNVLWFSRHKMTDMQEIALNLSIDKHFGETCDVFVTQLNGTIENVHKPFKATFNPEGTPNAIFFESAPLKEICKDFDIIAGVFLVNHKEQLLKELSDNKPLIEAISNRVLDSEGKTEFKFLAWQRVLKVEVVTAPF